MLFVDGQVIYRPTLPDMDLIATERLFGNVIAQGRFYNRWPSRKQVAFVL